MSSLGRLIIIVSVVSMSLIDLLCVTDVVDKF